MYHTCCSQFTPVTGATTGAGVASGAVGAAAGASAPVLVLLVLFSIISITKPSLCVNAQKLCDCTLIRKSPRRCVFTQAWGYIVITSYLGGLKFACVISQGFGLLLNKLCYNCMSYILTLHIKKPCKIKVTLDLFYQAMSLCNYTKVVWL